jgi:uncharacterized protein
MPNIVETPLIIPCPGGHLAARLYRNADNLVDRQKAILTTGSWLTVKEQMAHTSALAMAGRGYTVLAYDFLGWGQSAGDVRQLEAPSQKIVDIITAANFLRTLSWVEGGRIGYLAICASAQYVAAAIDRGAPIASFASIAGWFHDTTTVAAYYGGAAGLAMRTARARDAAAKFLATGETAFVPAFEEGNDRAGMFLPLDYYANPSRGRVPAWRNEMAEMSWLHWLTFDGISPAQRLRVPTLFVHGDECALPDNVKRIHAAMPGPKEMIWHPGFQVDYYDRPDLVGLAADAADRHFRRTLGQAQ